MGRVKTRNGEKNLDSHCCNLRLWNTMHSDKTQIEATDFPHLLLLRNAFQTSCSTQLLNVMAQWIWMVNPPFFSLKTKKKFHLLWNGVLILPDAQTTSCLRPIGDFFSSLDIVKWWKTLIQQDFCHCLQLLKNLEVSMAKSVVQFKIWTIRYRTCLVNEKEYYGTPEVFKMPSSRLFRNTILF